MSAVLSARGVSKAYHDWSGQPRTLHAVLARRIPLLRGSSRRRWALREVSFELAAGRSLGLVGHNGAGKSTLLRLASGLGRPTGGDLRVEADSASVLNLGTSFDPQLTGAENAYTAALIAGFRRRQASAALDGVIDFAGLHEFADAPVRTYSEGMKLRLAFGVITIRRPRLLVLDEVLSVGDLAFRRRCEDWIRAAQAQGTSLLLASHALEEIQETCEEALWLHHGRVRTQGPAPAVAEAYTEAMDNETRARTPVGGAAGIGSLVLGDRRFGSQDMTIEEVTINGRPAGAEPVHVLHGEPLRLGLRLAAHAPDIDDPIVGIALRRRGDETTVIDINTRNDGITLGDGAHDGFVEIQLDRLDVGAGEYAFDVGIYERDWSHAYDYHWMAYPIRVDGPLGGQGVAVPPHDWRLG